MKQVLMAGLVLAVTAGCGAKKNSGNPDGNTDTGGDAPADGVEDGVADTVGDGVDTSVDGGPECPSAVFCGSPPECCEEDEECIAGSCLPVCESGIRCGDALDLCCESTEVCVDGACVEPGDTCLDSYDCGLGMFCEPTLERCLPQFDPVTCEVVYEPEEFEVIEEWGWTTSETLPTYNQPISTPVVVDLDGDRVPEVVFAASVVSDWTDGVLRAIHGDTGLEYWTADDPSLMVNGRATIAAGDIDADGDVEILALSRGTPPSAQNSKLLCLGPDGTLEWEAQNSTGTTLEWVIANGGPTIADLDGDGFAEVILGGMVFDHSGVLQFDNGATEGTNHTYTGGLPAVADMDLDAEPEIVTGARAWETDGSALWDSTTDDGYPAIADFNDDGYPEVVLVASGYVHILQGTSGGAYWTPVVIPGGGIGGPPTVADFDGDGFPEIGVAGGNSYSVYDPDGADPVLWSHDTQDASSNATGSSVFDFEGDGIAEVVYCDECFMRVYAGQTGETLLAIMNSSLTIHEYPLVADVDGDGNSEILVVANADWYHETHPDYCDASAAVEGITDYVPRHGVFLYGDAHDRWVPTRRIWNQHTYHVTNVNSDGSIPVVEEDNWLAPGLNNYRMNVQGEGVFNAPDLTVIALSVSLSGCPDTVELQARVANIGNLGVVAGTEVAFYRGSPDDPGDLLGTSTVSVDLLPGASTLVTLSSPLTGEPPYAFFAVVDDDGTGGSLVAECDEDNNVEDIDGVDCDLLF